MKVIKQKQLLIYGTNRVVFSSNCMRRRISFGLTDILLVAMEKYYRFLLLFN